MITYMVERAGCQSSYIAVVKAFEYEMRLNMCSWMTWGWPAISGRLGMAFPR